MNTNMLSLLQVFCYFARIPDLVRNRDHLRLSNAEFVRIEIQLHKIDLGRT